MAKVKTFTSDLRIFKTAGQLDELDKTVNDFIQQNQIKVISVSDTTATDDSGATIGIIRVVTYE
jgi:hypothetical protein